MSVAITSVYVNGSTIEQLHDYNLIIDDETWKELNTYATNLNLHHLKCIYFAANCIFNVFQCQDVLDNEIPLLHKQNLSVKAKQILDGLELALRDTLKQGAHTYLLFEGD